MFSYCRYSFNNNKLKFLILNYVPYIQSMSQNSSLCLRKICLTSEDHIYQSLTERFHPQIRLAEMTSEKHKAHEHLKTSADQHQRTLSAYQQKVTALQEECRAAKVCSSRKRTMSQVLLSTNKQFSCGLWSHFLVFAVIYNKSTFQMNTGFSSSDSNPDPIPTLTVIHITFFSFSKSKVICLHFTLVLQFLCVRKFWGFFLVFIRVLSDC